MEEIEWKKKIENNFKIILHLTHIMESSIQKLIKIAQHQHLGETKINELQNRKSLKLIFFLFAYNQL